MNFCAEQPRTKLTEIEFGHVTPFTQDVRRKADLELVVGVGDQGVDGVGGNAAVVVLVTSHLDVAGIAPSS